jgi:hypothetical protein
MLLQPPPVTRATLAALALLATAACTPTSSDDVDTTTVASTSASVAIADAAPQNAFWDNMASHCPNAYPGRLVKEPPGDDMLRGDEPLVAHFRVCTDTLMHVAFHIETNPGEWDRSRTWVLMRRAAGIELRHDHRMPDGSNDESTWYGAFTIDEGAPDRQHFILTERRAPDGSQLGWRLEIEPGTRYTYGTIRGDEYTWQVEFDLSTPLETPPPAWGHEPGAPPRVGG